LLVKLLVVQATRSALTANVNLLSHNLKTKTRAWRGSAPWLSKLVWSQIAVNKKQLL